MYLNASQKGRKPLYILINLHKLEFQNWQMNQRNGETQKTVKNQFYKETPGWLMNREII